MDQLQGIKGAIRLTQIVEGTFFSPFVRITDLVRRLGVTYPTAKTDVRKLVDVGILEELPNVSPKTFCATKVFEVAYEDLDDGTPQPTAEKT